MKPLLNSVLILLWAIFTPALQGAAIRVLIVDGQNNHDWKHTTPELKKILEETGLFTVDVATAPPKGGDMAAFKPEFAANKVMSRD